MYITYAQYQAMGGTLDETAFNRYSWDASQAIKEATFNRITTPSEAVQRCMVRLIDLTAGGESQTHNITSFSNDGLSQSFNVMSFDERKRKNREIIRSYLINERDGNGVPLLYCGVTIGGVSDE